MAFTVDDIEAEIAELRSRGVVFEDYGIPGLPMVDNIVDVPGNYPSKGSGERGAWFRDSEGNLLRLGQPTPIAIDSGGRALSHRSTAAATHTIMAVAAALQQRDDELSPRRHESSASTFWPTSCRRRHRLARFVRGCCAFAPSTQ
jgi:hypothetical protein